MLGLHQAWFHPMAMGICGLLLVDPAGAEERPPNVVMIVADDLGWADISPNNPDTFYETPNLERLADRGVRFTQAYAAAPVCSPTRASLMTGRHPARLRTTDYFCGKRAGALLPADYECALPLEETTIAERLGAEGYRTFFAGKWHLGPEGFWPEDQGFQVNRGGWTRGGPYGGKKYFSPYGNPRLDDGPEGEHLPDRLARETATFIQESEDTPFLAVLSFYSVHTPLMGPKDLVAKYRARKQDLDPGPIWGRERARKVRLVQEHAVYASMVESMDAAVGVVLDAIDAAGIAEDTIVVFFSDNGGLSTSEGHPTSNLPFRAGKGWLYEGGIREPCIMSVPGVTGSGVVCDAPITSHDFLPTVLELCGIESASERPLDGRSIVPLLGDPDASDPARVLHWHYPHYGNQGGAPSGAIREGDWKLIEWFEDDSVELYDLANDPGERTNLVRNRPEVAEHLRKSLQAWREGVDAVMPTPNPEHEAKSGTR
ncbi:MAG: sulfatase [Planctomycetaceae bacterium]|nr:sulfatase [Planctomycetaceae bacterium]